MRRWVLPFKKNDLDGVSESILTLWWCGNRGKVPHARETTSDTTQHDGSTTRTHAATTRTTRQGCTRTVVPLLHDSSTDNSCVVRMPQQGTARTHTHTARTGKARWKLQQNRQEATHHQEHCCGTQCWLGRLEGQWRCIAETALNAGEYAHVVLTRKTRFCAGKAGVVRPAVLKWFSVPAQANPTSTSQTSLLTLFLPSAALPDASYTTRASVSARLFALTRAEQPPRRRQRAVRHHLPASICGTRTSSDWTAPAPISKRSGYFITNKTRPIMLKETCRYIIKAKVKLYGKEAMV